MNVPTVIRAVPYNDQDILESAHLDQRLANGEAPLGVFREALQRGTERLRELFYRGLSAAELVPARARLMDQLIVRAWRRLIPVTDQLALVAVGGYGRGELHPGSDVDLMVLGSSDQALTQHQSPISAFLTFLWDVGIEVGQSVRTPQDCEAQGRADVTVATNLMEARLLAGPDQLFQTMRTQTGPDAIWPTAAFFEAKRQEQARRHQRFHDTAYNLEPNVKEGPGSLRDIQTIGWVAKRHFGAETLHDLVSHGFLTETEYQELVAGQNFLWRVRFALHTLTGRREDRLLFDYQRQIAVEFGYRDGPHNLAIEQFMQRYYRSIMQLSRLNEMLLQLFEEAILLGGEPGDPVPLNKRFQVRRGYIEATSSNIFRRYPFALLEVFLQLAQHPELKGVRASTIRLIREHKHLIDDRFRHDVRATSLFMEILRQRQGITHELRRMNAYGILGAYLPEFGQILGRMQYDLFHVYTVDQHTLFVVRNLRRFYLPKHAAEMPQCSALMQRVPKPHLLYIAALYHDIAKGRAGDHSELGAVDARTFCRRHGLSQFDTRLVVWLVQNHLLMSLTAQKKDINDPQVVHDFAKRVGDLLYLNHLYLLTVADIRATNPKLWNSWRDSLLRELYEATRRSMRQGLESPVDREERIRETQTLALVLLERKGIDRGRIELAWEDFTGDYFLRHNPEEIAWHTRAVLKKAADDRALVLARAEPSGTQIFIYKRNRDTLFATTTAVLDQLGLTVVDARILTAASGFTLDTYTVLEADGEPILERARIRAIVDRLRRELNQAHGPPPEPSRRPSRRLRHFRTPTTVSFAGVDALGRTVLELMTADRPGLLSRVGWVFRNLGVRIHNARIATLGERAEDVFFVTDSDNRPYRDATVRERIREALVEELDGERAAAS